MIGQGEIKTVRGSITTDDTTLPNVSTAVDLTDGGRDIVLEIDCGASDTFTVTLLMLNRDETDWTRSESYESTAEEGELRRIDALSVGNEEAKIQVRITDLTGTINGIEGYSTNLKS